MIELDRKIFTLCKPKGISDLGDGLWDVSDAVRRKWSPSERWEDLEPEIRKACIKRGVRFSVIFFGEDGDDADWRADHDACEHDFGGRTACEAAALALIALKESEAKNE